MATAQEAQIPAAGSASANAGVHVNVSPNTYLRYKSATDSFISFLCTTLGVASDKSQKTEVIEALVDQVCARYEASVKLKNFRTNLKDACDACAQSIGMRESFSRKYLKFPNDANAGHLHFIEILKNSLRKLKATYKDYLDSPTDDDDDDDAVGTSTIRNTFSALSLEEDEEDEGGDEADPNDTSLGFASSSGNMGSYTSFSTSAGGGGEKVSNEVPETAPESFEFEEDLVFQILSFITEIEDISEQVSLAWMSVKEEKLSVISASIITAAAINSVESLSASLEVNFPSILSYTDLVTVMEKYMPESVFKDSLLALGTNYEKYANNGYSKQFYSKGAEINEMGTISQILEKYATKLEAIPNKMEMSCLKEGIFGAVYNENVAPPPFFCPPGTKVPASGTNLDFIGVTKQIEAYTENNRVFTFLMSELPALELFATCMDGKDLEIGGINLGSVFLKVTRKFFKDRIVTTTLVFTVLCWLKSVLYLQGECFIQRTVSTLKNQLIDIHRRLSQSIDKGHVKKSDEELHEVMVALKTRIHEVFLDPKGYVSFLLLFKNNPFGAANMVVGTYFQCLHISCETLLVTSRFRAFGHLYSALLDRNLLQNIPYLDNLLEVYNEMIFCPSRPKFGEFVKTYLLSSHLTARTVASLTGKTTYKSRNKNMETVRRKVLHAHDLSQVYQYFAGGEKSNESFKNATSFADLIKRLGLISSQELFNSRILGHDVFAINDFLFEVFEELTDLLERREFYDRYVATGEPQQHEKFSVHYRIQRAGEDSVMNPLIYILDAINLDFRKSKDLSGLLKCTTSLESTGSRNVYEYCLAAANFVKEKFSGLDVEKTFFIFPASVNHISKDFGKANIVDYEHNPQPRGYVSMNRFTSWLDRFEFQSQRLRQEEVVQFKNEVRRDPSLMSHVCFDAVPTIFQWLIAGPHKDEHLAEWCINMGAMAFESINRFWEDKTGLRDRAILATGNMAPDVNLNSCSCLERVVVHGDVSMFKLIFESNSLMSVNIRSGETLNSMAHIACLNGHKDMYHCLKFRGVDLSVANKKGKYFYEMTKDAVWAQELKKDYDTYLSVVERSQSLAATWPVRKQKIEAQYLKRENLVLTGLSYQKIQGAKTGGGASAAGGSRGGSSSAKVSVKQGVNDKCNCGSGKKYKKCCMI